MVKGLEIPLWAPSLIEEKERTPVILEMALNQLLIVFALYLMVVTQTPLAKTLGKQ